MIKLVTESLSILEFGGGANRFLGLVRVVNETFQISESLKKIRWAIVNVTSLSAKLSKGSDTAQGDSR